MSFRLLGLDHVAVAVRDLDEAMRPWLALGLRRGDREVVADQGVEVQMLHAGDVRIELVAPLGPDTPVGRYLEKHGPGIHHLALAVDDCAAAVAAAKDAGLRLVDETPRRGAHGTRIAFVHPAAMGGVLTELVAAGDAPAGEGDPS